jgi:hypothetical protein
MGLVPDLLYASAVAKSTSREVLCHDWDALKSAAKEREIAYEFDGHELHVWTRRPEVGDRCDCGARKWT